MMPIEDYALIGDCETTALVGRDGAIDWLCWPRFDSAACFAALLGTAENGRWKIAPDTPVRHTTRRYRPDTLVLETRHETESGVCEVVDFMPLRSGNPDLVRIVTGISGAVPIHMDLTIRFDYGRTTPWVTRLPSGRLRAIAGPNMLVLDTAAPLHGEGMATVSNFVLRAGESVSFVLSYAPSHQDLPVAVDPWQALLETESFWSEWASRCMEGGPWQAAVRRSLITLKALTYRPTGGIVAAATTSLPEVIGGVRNWDYRYCWLRDATFTLLALMDAGYFDEAEAWRDWLVRAIAGNPEQMQIMYGLGGERDLPERELPWLAGYEGSRPVRVGNGAAGQLQLDVYGEVADALHVARKGGLAPSETAWRLECALANHLGTCWREPDEGIWEVRGPRQHFTHSKVMAWVAFDRAVKAVERGGLSGPVAQWRTVRDEIHAEVCARAFNSRRGAFMQAYDSTELDASLLLMPLVGFLPANDPRITGTVAAIERELTVDGFVLRYHTHTTDDGLPPGEGAFLACSFWLADNMVLQGRIPEARALFQRLLTLCNDVGLLAEEYDPHGRRLLGNFPQAFSHVALVNTALNLTRSVGPAGQRGDGED